MTILNNESPRLPLIRHSTAHVMAEAVKNLFEGALVAIGPAIDTGFYYDFLLPRPIKNEDLPEIEKEMRRILSSGAPFVKDVISRDVALQLFKDQPFKIELINGLAPDAEISTYTSGKFVDLCRGPHVESMKEINPKAFRLTKIAGAYWRGDEKNAMLTRIYGTAWESPQDLKEYLTLLEEAEKRDHRKIGVALDLFHLDDEDPGQVFWHPKGWDIYLTVQNYVRKRLKEDGYLEVNTPFVMPRSLWERSGHWAKYQENMFITESEKRTFALKPMNCPGHVEIFKRGIKSYRDLPLRLAEFGSCTRNEPSGSLHGIMRVRGFVQDDAHIFCRDEQISEEVAKFCTLLKRMYKDFGFPPEDIKVKFSTRPLLRIGDDETWDMAEAALKEACNVAKLEYTIAEGEGAFYGPKLEFTLIDAIGRQWQCGTIQVDYQLPSKERLNAEYIGEDNTKKHPVMLHRAALGSLERFIGILIENCAGLLPPWLAPIQAVIIPVAPTFSEYAIKVQTSLQEAGIKAQADSSNERMNAKIRKHQNLKVPYLLIVGEKEMGANEVSVRFRGAKEQQTMSLASFIEYIENKITTFSTDV